MLRVLQGNPCWQQVRALRLLGSVYADQGKQPELAQGCWARATLAGSQEAAYYLALSLIEAQDDTTTRSFLQNSRSTFFKAMGLTFQVSPEM